MSARALVVAAGLASCASAWAQSEDLSWDIERFRPHTDHYGYVNTDSATTLDHLEVGVGLWGNHARDALVWSWDDQTVDEGTGQHVVEQRSLVDLQLGIGIGQRLGITIDVPLVLWQEGFDPGRTDGDTDLIASGVSDVRLTTKVVVLDPGDHSPIGIGVLGQLGLPTGDTRSFLGEGAVSGLAMALFEVADGSVRRGEYHVRFALNGGYRVRHQGRFRDLEIDDEILFRAALAARPERHFELGVELEGAHGGRRQAQRPLEVLPWFKVHPSSWVTLTGGAGFGLVDGVGSPRLRLFLGGTLAPSFDPSRRDRDHDGIVNKFDGCVNVPEDLDGWQDHDGCPEDDNDLDGIVDKSDACPIVPEDRDGFEDLDGCPDPDNDQDGILDIADRCRDTPETVNGFEDLDGCPDEVPLYDSDGDGLLDDDDACPRDAEDPDGWEDQDGCPDVDNDQDGILDVDDRCLNVPETHNGFEDEDGCPDEVPPPAPVRVVVTREKIEISEKIHFEVDKATIQPVSYGLLDEVADTITDHPDLMRIRVEGHTDSDGSNAYNLALSRARSQAVVDYLVAHGVDVARLYAEGFGEDRPLEPNRTSQGKAANRRVEFVIVEQ